MQEQLSLSDRFGLTITFLNPDKKEYLDIVENLLATGILKNTALTLINFFSKLTSGQQGEADARREVQSSLSTMLRAVLSVEKNGN